MGWTAAALFDPNHNLPQINQMTTAADSNDPALPGTEDTVQLPAASISFFPEI